MPQLDSIQRFGRWDHQNIRSDFPVMPLKKQNNCLNVLLPDCLPLRLPFTVALFQPLPYILQIVKKRPFATKVSDLPLLYYTHPFIGNTISHISVVVHAVGHQLTLRWQGKLLNEFARRSQPLLQVLVFPYAERALAHRRGHPAIRWMSLINVH